MDGQGGEAQDRADPGRAGHEAGCCTSSVVAGIGTLPGLVAPSLTGHLIDAADSPAHGYTTAFLIAATVMLVAGLVTLTAIRPERDARRLGLGHKLSNETR